MSDIQANELQVFASPLPFSNKHIQRRVDLGLSVAEIIDEVCPLNHPDIGACVMIDGVPLSRMKWRDYYPESGALINIRVVPQGGGGGKNPLATLLTIAVLVAAPYAGAFLAEAAFGAGLIGSVGGIIAATPFITAAVGVIGRLAISALIPPPKQSNSGTVSNPSESPTQFIEGARNTINPYGVVPIILGTNRMFPLQAALPFTETVGADQYVRQLFTYGWGESIEISNIQIGETAITSFTDVEMQHKLAGDLNVSTSLYSNAVHEDDYSVLLQQVDGYSTRTTQQGVDEATVDFTFTGGLATFDANGARQAYSVQLTLEFAKTGESPQNWSPGAGAWTAFGGADLAIAAVTPTAQGVSNVFGTTYNGFRRDMIVVDKYTGAISVVKGTSTSTTANAAVVGSVPSTTYRLATVLVQGKRVGVVTTQSIVSLSDDRQPGDFGQLFQNSSSFVPTFTGTTVHVSGGGISISDFITSAAQTEALRVSKNVKFPTNGQYDIRVKRITADSTSSSVLDKVYLSAVKSITHIAPVNLVGINGTALRMKGTDQLNGAVDQFNVLASNIILDYDAPTDTWIKRATSNPASLMRYVLQGPANAKALPDGKISISDLEAWHVYCDSRGYTYNRIIDYDTSVDEVLRDIATAGAATPTIVDGKRTIVVDQEKDDIVQIVTPRNSWSYSGEMAYPDTPDAFRVTFRNAANGYQNDERIVYADGFDKTNAKLFETLEYLSCTNSDLAFKHGRRYLATVLLRPETHTFMMDVENLVFTRGDRIKFEHDIPIIGVGDGRIKSVRVTGDGGGSLGSLIQEDGSALTYEDGGEILLETPGGAIGSFVLENGVDSLLLEDGSRLNLEGYQGTSLLLVEDGGELLLEDDSRFILEESDVGGTIANTCYGFTIDDVVGTVNDKTYYVRIRKSDGSQIYKELVSNPGEQSSFTFAVPFTSTDSPEPGDLCFFVEAGGECDLVVSKIEPQDDLTARITCVDYAPAIFTAETDPIPPFNTHLSSPLELQRPNAPVLVGTPQSDESVMLVNPDGSYTSRMIITLQNINGDDVFPVIQLRKTGTLPFVKANTLQASPTLIILTGLDDGQRYDVQIRYQRSGSAGVLSLPLQINNYKFLGTAGPPRDVQNLTINVIGSLAAFKWNANTDIDIDHYHMKFSTAYDGATWETAQDIDANIPETQYSTVFQGGTYFVKAVDRTGNESVNAALVISYDPGVQRNVVDILDESGDSPYFPGFRDNVALVGATLILDDVTQDGYYYFDRTIDFGETFNAYLSASIMANGAFTNDVYDMVDLFTVSNVFAGGTNNVFDMPDLYLEDDIYGIGLNSWKVELQYRTTQDDTHVSPVAWGDWIPFVPGLYNFRGVQARLLLRSLSPVNGITPVVTGLSMTVDMPDRSERGDDLAVLDTGVVIAYATPFAATPALAILLQDAVSGDEIQFTSKTASGFAFKVYNANLAAFVNRTFDFIASGYGRG